MASAWTLAAPAVVIMRRCTSEMRPCGNRTMTIDLGAAAERLDRGAAGIARGRDHDGAALAARAPARGPSAAPEAASPDP